MYRIGYIDDDPRQYQNYARKLKRKDPNMELVLFRDCSTKEEFVNKIYEEHADVLLIDYKMAAAFGFNGSTLINYINDQVRDLSCFILTAVEEDKVEDGLVQRRNIYSKTIFDTEADTPDLVEKLKAFMVVLKESADEFRKRRKLKEDEYKTLFEKGE
ncbi:MAG: hypothetical protein RSB57_00465 [Hungatella sp.]